MIERRASPDFSDHEAKKMKMMPIPKFERRESRVSNDLENLEKSGNFIEFKKNQGEIREFRDSSWKNHNLPFIGLILSGLMEFPASLLKKFLT